MDLLEPGRPSVARAFLGLCMEPLGCMQPAIPIWQKVSYSKRNGQLEQQQAGLWSLRAGSSENAPVLWHADFQTEVIYILVRKLFNSQNPSA
jgi:hypothetical protein